MRSGAHGATALHGPWQVTNREALVGVPSFSAPGCGALAGQVTPSVGRVCPRPGASLGFEKLRPGLESDLLSPTA